MGGDIIPESGGAIIPETGGDFTGISTLAGRLMNKAG